MTFHRIIFGDARNMGEIPDNSIHLVVTSPPYYNAPFDYPDLFPSYGAYLDLIKDVGKEIYRVLEKGRVACFVVQDVRINKELYPVTSDIINVMREVGFSYKERIIWRKPEGYIRISRRSGVLLQHSYPMYFYPDNIYEDIVIFQKGQYNHARKRKMLGDQIFRDSRIDIKKFQKEKWYLTVWDITNVLPLEGRLEEGVASFPEEIPKRLITLYSFKGETVLDPFLGSGTTTKVAIELERNSWGYEIDLELEPIIKEKIGFIQKRLSEVEFEIIKRKDATRLRTFLQEKVKSKRRR